MNIIISALEADLESPICERFGRAPYFLSVDTETMAWEAHANQATMRAGGAGVAAAQFVIDQKVEGVISGDFGPNAAGALRAANIAMYLFNDETKTVNQAVKLFKENKLANFA